MEIAGRNLAAREFVDETLDARFAKWIHQQVRADEHLVRLAGRTEPLTPFPSRCNGGSAPPLKPLYVTGRSKMILREDEQTEVLRVKFPGRLMTSHVAANASFWQTFVLPRHLVSYGMASLALLFVIGCQTSRIPFYPIGIYWDQSTNELPVLRDAGFNVVAGAANRAYLDAANRSSQIGRAHV